jgi:hypothetical protein
MHFLSGNAPIMSIARRFGMDIVTAAGESRAHLELPPPSLPSLIASTNLGLARETAPLEHRELKITERFTSNVEVCE